MTAPASSAKMRGGPKLSLAPVAATVVGATDQREASNSSPCDAASRRRIVISVARAFSIGTPASSRPNTDIQPQLREWMSKLASGPVASRGHVPTGTQRSGKLAKAAPRKLFGATPTTVSGTPFTWIERPRIPGSPPNSLRQRPSESTATGSPPSFSEGWNGRPSAGRVPRTSK